MIPLFPKSFVDFRRNIKNWNSLKILIAIFGAPKPERRPKKAQSTAKWISNYFPKMKHEKLTIWYIQKLINDLVAYLASLINKCAIIYLKYSRLVLIALQSTKNRPKTWGENTCPIAHDLVPIRLQAHQLGKSHTWEFYRIHKKLSFFPRI